MLTDEYVSHYCENVLTRIDRGVAALCSMTQSLRKVNEKFIKTLTPASSVFLLELASSSISQNSFAML